MAWGSLPRRRSRPPRRLTVLGRALAALGLALLVAAGIAFAATPSTDPVGDMVGYMQRAQNEDGGFGGVAGAASDPGFTAWVAIALAAAGINPRDQKRPGGRDVHSYLLQHAHELTVTTDFERVALAAHAAGTSLRDFGGIDLVQRILERQNADDSFPHDAAGAGGVNDTIWAVLSLAPVGEEPVRARLVSATEWILGAQNPDGGWPAVMKGGPTDLDMTGAAIQALNAVGRRETEAQRRAFELLRRAQHDDGGFPSIATDHESNTATTAWVVQGIWCAGQNPGDWNTASGRDPLDYLASMQRPDGSIRWKHSQDLNPLWMTAYAAPAYAGRCHPIAEVPPCECKPSDPPDGPPSSDPPPTPAPGTGGDGGSDPTGGGSALAGGGGRGAPLFSKPKPQSRGRTRGGARRTRDDAAQGRVRGAAQRGAAAQRARERAAARRGASADGAVAPGGDDGAQTPAPADPATPARAEEPEPATPEPLAGEGEDDAGALASREAKERAGGAGGADALSTGAGEADGAGAAGDPQVTGTLIGDDTPLAAGDDAAAAPGIRGAKAGGQSEPALALGLSGVMLLAAGCGMQVERRRPTDTEVLA